MKNKTSRRKRKKEAQDLVDKIKNLSVELSPSQKKFLKEMENGISIIESDGVETVILKEEPSTAVPGYLGGITAEENRSKRIVMLREWPYIGPFKMDS